MSYNPLDLQKGAENIVEVANVRAGDNVAMVLSRRLYEPAWVEAVSKAIQDKGGIPIVVLVPSAGRGSEGAAFEESNVYGSVPRSVSELLKHADTVISNVIAHKGGSSVIPKYEYGTNFVRLDGASLRAEGLAAPVSRYPVELSYALIDKTADIIERAKTLRVTTNRGTDMTIGQIRGHNNHHSNQRPGFSESYPVAQFGLHPEAPCNGLVVVDYLNACKGVNNGGPALLKEPLKITVENQRAVKVEGSEFEKEVKAAILKDKDSAWCGECMWGTRPSEGPTEPPDELGTWISKLHNRCDMLHFVFGAGLTDVAVPPRGGPITAWCLMYNYTLCVDGEKFVDNGRMKLLDDPDVRSLARKYGDPDELLGYKPVPAARIYTPNP